MSDKIGKPECIVCYELLSRPIYQCFDGHLLCEGCIAKVNQCPVCRDELPADKRIRCRGLEAVIEERNLSCPCKAKLMEENAESHKLDCPQAVFNFCPYLGMKECKDVVARNELTAHLEGKHYIQVLENPEMFACRQGMPRCENDRVWRWKPVCLLHDGKLFFVQTNMPYGHWITWFVYVLGSRETAARYSWAFTVLEDSSIGRGYITWEAKALSPLVKLGESKPRVILPLNSMSQKWTMVCEVGRSLGGLERTDLDSKRLRRFVESLPVYDGYVPPRKHIEHKHWCFTCNQESTQHTLCQRCSRRPGKDVQPRRQLCIAAPGSGGIMGPPVPWSEVRNTICVKPKNSVRCKCMMACGPSDTEI